ncbi:MAG: phosphotransferase [Ardenticatenales bacterium]|nr:phosphotransferase [Ardenticatenales bacterium]
MPSLPDHFTRRINDVFQEAGAAWLARLPAIIAACEQRWALTALPAFANLSYNYVAPALGADGSEVVLKLGVPHLDFWREMEVLRLYDGRGMVRLLDSDPELGAMLLERLQPGTPLAHLVAEDDERATTIAAEVMQALWRPAPAGASLPTVVDWAAGMGKLRRHFDGGTGPLPTPLVEQAERLFAELLSSQAEPVMLHGDLHHENILAAQREPWLALDPKGILGEPAYEVGALLRNPRPQLLAMSDLRRLFARRVDQLAEALGVERERIVGWGMAQAVLSAWWSIEDHEPGWEFDIACAEQLAALMK